MAREINAQCMRMHCVLLLLLSCMLVASAINPRTARPLPAGNDTPAPAYDTSFESGKFRVGYDALPRSHLDSLHDAIYLLHYNAAVPTEGDLISWHIYANRTGNVTLMIWRHTNGPNVYRIVGMNNFTILVAGEVIFPVPDGRQIHVAEGDVIGVYFPNLDPISFSKSPNKCSHEALYIEHPCEFSRCKEFVFRQELSGWNPCRVYSINAIFVNTSHSDRDHNVTVTASVATTLLPATTSSTAVTAATTPSTVLPTEPSIIDVMLVNGRRPSEGLLMVRSRDSDWGTVCDDGWDDVDATVACRMLGYKGGYAKFAPLFGHGNETMAILLDDMQCNGTEEQLSQCTRQSKWTDHNCNHHEDVGVQCVTEANENPQHLFGYPAVPRYHIETWKEGVVIPHPHHRLPWTSGTIRSWHLYIQSTTPVNLTLQIWRQRTEYEYQLVGQNVLYNLNPGNHDVMLEGQDRIQFEAGDVIGINFRNYNPIPYDVSTTTCPLGERELYIPGPINSYMQPGTVFRLSEKPQHWRACRMYSLYMMFDGSERSGNYLFSLGHSLYKIVTDQQLSREGAKRACALTLGSDSALVDINSEEEFAIINGALNSMGVRNTLQFWCGGYLWQEERYRKWGKCEPVEGKECIVVSKPSLDDLYSTDLYYMYSKKCHETHPFICEKSAEAFELFSTGKSRARTTTTASTTPDLTTTRTEVIVSKTIFAREALDAGVVAAIVVLVVVSTVVTVLTTLVLLRRWRNRQCPNDISESTVRFISLHDKPPI